jgi:hypothetical protein
MAGFATHKCRNLRKLNAGGMAQAKINFENPEMIPKRAL